MIPPVLDDFWTVSRLAVLGTVRPDGSPHQVPVRAMRDRERFLTAHQAA